MKKRVWTVMPVFLIFVALLFAMSFISYKYSFGLFLVEIGISLIALAAVLIMTFSFKSYVRSIINDAVDSVYNVDKDYIESIATPVAVVGENGEILLYNSKFKTAFFNGKEPINENIAPYISNTDLRMAQKSGVIETEFSESKYSVYVRSISKGVMFTFIDNTYYKDIVKEYNETKKSVALIVFDNIEDFATDSEDEATQAMITVEGLLQRWAAENNSLFRKLSDNRYMVIFDERVLIKQLESKFSVLDNVRKITYNGRMATVSIGVGRNCESLRESQQNAKKALDMALGRGGDQVAVLNNGEYQFFGGVSKGVEKTSKVRVRVISDSVKSAIASCDKVLIMGHRFSDLDCIGAATGIYSTITKIYKKPAYIVTDVEKSMAKLMIEHLSSENKDMFISGERALVLANQRTLLFVVDTHSPDFLESERVYKNCGKVIVIDHHRKMVNFINDAVVFFHEPMASSTSELVTELIGYLGDDGLNHIEAEALLAGIMLDTKNFVIKTGVRTFEAAAYLRKKGADTVIVRNLFSNSLESYKDKYRLVSKAQIINHCAITVADESIKDSRIICAQAADDLLGIQDVYASFVISQLDFRTVNISARSFGKINVQIIMEKLGGGGHQTMAAAQLADITLEKARENLVAVLSEEEILK